MPHKKSGQERRRHPRVKLVAACHVHACADRFNGTLVDISPGGLCLEADIRIVDRDHAEGSDHFATGSTITVDIPKLNLVRLEGTVVRVDSGRLGYTVAVEFHSIRHEVAVKIIDAFAKRLK